MTGIKRRRTLRLDDRKLREYAINIYKGISGYTLNKAFSLFPKYYPKIAFYYTEILNKQQSEMSMRMIQALGIDKGISLMNELNDLNAKMLKFYVDAKFKINESYRKIEAAKDEYDRSNIIGKEMADGFQIAKQTIDLFKKGADLLIKIYDEAKIYNFKRLENDILKTMEMNHQANNELYRLNLKFLEYLKQYKT